MQYCQVNKGGKRDPRVGNIGGGNTGGSQGGKGSRGRKNAKGGAGEQLKVSTGVELNSGVDVLIIVAANERRPKPRRKAVCVDEHQVNITLPARLQEKFHLVGHKVVRCTGAGHDRGQFEEDGFVINGHDINGRPQFMTLADLIGEDVVIMVLPDGTERVSTFDAFPKAIEMEEPVAMTPSAIEVPPMMLVQQGVAQSIHIGT